MNNLTTKKEEVPMIQGGNEENSRTRARGRLGRVKFGPDPDHGDCPVFAVTVHGVGGAQSFQLTFDNDGQLRAFVRDFCAVFGVADAERLGERECYALRCFSRAGECIEGIESAETGRRITRTAWWRANVDPNLPSPLESAGSELSNAIARHERQAHEARVELAALASLYVSWDPPTAADVVAENGLRFGWCACSKPARLHAHSTFCATCEKVIPR